jgi:hypothetical protein
LRYTTDLGGAAKMALPGQSKEEFKLFEQSPPR